MCASTESNRMLNEFLITQSSMYQIHGYMLHFYQCWQNFRYSSTLV